MIPQMEVLTALWPIMYDYFNMNEYCTIVFICVFVVYAKNCLQCLGVQRPESTHAAFRNPALGKSKYFLVL
jgi:hypothetical protein